MYEFFEHTADVGIRIQAESLEHLFADAAKGLFSLFTVNLESVQPVKERTYNIEGDQLDYLLFDWLTELLFTFETEQLLLAEFNIKVTEGGLQATCRGEPIDRQRHEMDHEVKAITYHELKVEPVDGGWLAEVIVDI